MGFGVKVVEKATGKVIWSFPMDDIREIIMGHGRTDAFVRSLQPPFRPLDCHIENY